MDCLFVAHIADNAFGMREILIIITSEHNSFAHSHFITLLFGDLKANQTKYVATIATINLF